MFNTHPSLDQLINQMVYRKPARPQNRYRTMIRYGMRTAGRLGLGAARSYLMNRMNKRVSSGHGITTQYDRRAIYKKKYMPRRKKAQWRSFSKKVNAVAEKGLGTKTVVFNNQVTTSFTADQTVAFVHLYSYKGVQITPNNETPANDLERIWLRDGLSDAARVHFKSAVLDITFNGYPPDTADDAPMEVDVYELMYKKKNAPASFNTLLSTAETQTTTMAGYLSGLTLGTRGVTPFDLPQLARMGVTILKKTKYFLSRGGSTFTYQIRDPKNRWMNGASISLETPGTEFFKGGWTRTLLFVIKAVPGTTPIAGSGIQIGATRKYCYVRDESSTVQDGYL